MRGAHERVPRSYAWLLTGLLAVQCLAAACGGRDSPSDPARSAGEEVLALEDVLRMSYRGESLGALLLGSEKSWRARLEAVLGLHTLLGHDAGRWLARAIEAGVPPERSDGFALLELDLLAAKEACELLRKWVLAEPATSALRVRIARVLLELDLGDVVAQEALLDALRSSREEVIDEAMLTASVLGEPVMRFAADDLLSAVLVRTELPGHLWQSSLLDWLENVQDLTSVQRERLWELRQEVEETWRVKGWPLTR